MHYVTHTRASPHTKEMLLLLSCKCFHEVFMQSAAATMLAKQSELPKPNYIRPASSHFIISDLIASALNKIL